MIYVQHRNSTKCARDLARVFRCDEAVVTTCRLYHSRCCAVVAIVVGWADVEHLNG